MENLCILFITFLRGVATASPGKNILILTHGGGMAVLLKRTHKEISNGALIKLASDGVDFFVQETKGIILPE